MLAYKNNINKNSIKSTQNQVEAILHLYNWGKQLVILKRKTQRMQGNKLNLSTTKRKGYTSHGTRTKHQLQLFKNFWNDTFENSIPSINLNISTILICFRFTSCLFPWGFCGCDGTVSEEQNTCSSTEICCTFGLPVTFAYATIDNQLGDKQINSW